MVRSPAGRSRFRRAAFEILRGRLLEPRRYLNVVAGPRQVGKTTMVGQVAAELPYPVHAVSADDPGLRDRTWLESPRSLATSCS
jgi:predicted AAA+ superfamily ATPase